MPLHIFEQRYKNLLSRCVDTGEPFGVVLRLGDGVAAVGCAARLVAVLDEFPDGRSNIVVRGETPFRILEIDSPDDADQEPMSVLVQYLEEESGEVSSEEFDEESHEGSHEESKPAGAAEAGSSGAPTPLAELLRRLVAARVDDPAIGDEEMPPFGEGSQPGAEALVGPEAAIEAEGDYGRDSAQRSYRIAVDADLDIGIKQRLLESRRESERLSLITHHLETLVPRLEVIESRREAIRGNGKGD